MALITEVPTNPTIYPNAGTVTTGLASALRSKINIYAGTIEDKAQLEQAFHEQLCALLGNGAIGGGAVSAGSGLNAIVAAHTAIVGNYLRTDASSTVSLTNAATNYIWARQDGGFTPNTTGAIPGTADNKGTAILWAQVVTSGGTVSSVDNTRTYVLYNTGDVAAGSAAAGAGTVNATKGVVTSEPLTTAAGAAYTLAITNNRVGTASIVNADVYNGTNAAGVPVVSTVTPTAGTVTVVVQNVAAAAAFNGTLKVMFSVL